MRTHTPSEVVHEICLQSASGRNPSPNAHRVAFSLSQSRFCHAHVHKVLFCNGTNVPNCLQARSLLLEQRQSEGSGKIKAIFPPGPFKSGLSRTLQVCEPPLFPSYKCSWDQDPRDDHSASLCPTTVHFLQLCACAPGPARMPPLLYPGTKGWRRVSFLVPDVCYSRLSSVFWRCFRAREEMRFEAARCAAAGSAHEPGGSEREACSPQLEPAHACTRCGDTWSLLHGSAEQVRPRPMFLTPHIEAPHELSGKLNS